MKIFKNEIWINIFYLKLIYNKFFKSALNTIVTIFFILTVFSSFSQQTSNSTLDSLKLAYTKSSIDTVKVNLLLDISYNFQRQNLDSAIKYAQLGLNDAKKINYIKGIALANRYLGVAYSFKGEFTKALNPFNKSLDIYISLKDGRNVAIVYSNLGHYYAELKNEIEAVKNFNKANKLYLKQNNKAGLATNYSNLGVLFSYLMKYDKSTIYYQKALDLLEDLNDENGKFSALFNLAADYNEKDNLCNAFKYAFLAKDISDKLNTPYDKAFSSSLIGELYLRVHKDSLNTMAKCNQYLQGGTSLVKAEIYLTAALENFEKVNDLWAISSTHELLADLNSLKGDYKLALEHYKLYKELKDSVFSVDNSSAIINIEKQREIDLKNKEAKIIQLEREKENSRFNSIIEILLVLILVIITAVYYRFKKHKLQRDLNKKLAAKNEELQKINTVKDKFFSIISHDLRSPFNSLIGLSDLLLTNLDTYDKNKIKKFSESINKTAKQTHELLENLLEWSSIQTNSIVPNFKNCNLLELVNGVVLTLGSALENKNLILINNVSKDFYSYCDCRMIKSVLLNLISNAIKFSEKGNVIIDASLENSFIKISIKDNGVGMSTDRLNRVFNEGELETTNGTDNEKGTGLGLLICKEFIEKHGGELKCDSKLGKGSTFIFTIPNKKEQK